MSLYFPCGGPVKLLNLLYKHIFCRKLRVVSMRGYHLTNKRPEQDLLVIQYQSQFWLIDSVEFVFNIRINIVIVDGRGKFFKNFPYFNLLTIFACLSSIAIEVKP